MTMKKVLLSVRYTVFGLFIVCNAILCSVAAWSRSIAPYIINRDQQIDTFLIAVSAVGLAFIFPIMFVDLALRNPVTSRVWFECLWLSVFWVLELCAACAATSILPDLRCNELGDAIYCSSTFVLVAFSWTAATALLVYLVFLTLAAVMHQKRDPQIWQCAVRYFPWILDRQALASSPPSPSLPRFIKKVPIVAPQPRRANYDNLYSYRAGLDPNYEIEHYHPPTCPENVQEKGPAFVPPTQSSFYGHHVQSALDAQNQPRMAPPPLRIPTAHSPPPLGDWPRANVIIEPLRAKRKASTQAAPQATSAPPPVAFSTRAPPNPRRPSGPRRPSISSSEEQGPS